MYILPNNMDGFCVILSEIHLVNDKIDTPNFFYVKTRIKNGMQH